jgi:hypothetical protein
VRIGFDARAAEDRNRGHDVDVTLRGPPAAHTASA